MVRLHAGSAVSIEFGTGDGRRMAVDDLVHVQRDQQLIQLFFSFVEDPGIVHEFAKAWDVAVSDGPLDVKSIHDRAGVLKRRGRHAARDHVADRKLRLLSGTDHIVKPLKPVYIHDLMGIRDHRRGSAGHDHAPEFFRGGVGGLDMDMGIDQAWRGIGALCVKFFLPSVVIAEPDDIAVRDGDGILAYRSGVDINNIAVIDDQIRRDPVHRSIDHTAKCSFIHVLHTASSFDYVRLHLPESLLIYNQRYSNFTTTTGRGQALFV